MSCNICKKTVSVKGMNVCSYCYNYPPKNDIFRCKQCHREDVSVFTLKQHMCPFCEVCAKPFGRCKQCSKEDNFVNHTFLHLCSDCYSKCDFNAENVMEIVPKDNHSLHIPNDKVSKMLAAYFRDRPEILELNA